MVKEQAKLTQKQAKLLCDAFEIDERLSEGDEAEWLELHNPELLEAYRALQLLAD